MTVREFLARNLHRLFLLFREARKVYFVKDFFQLVILSNGRKFYS
nr:MAG TPA: hypothetical protein [Caudoviricetes sp.]